ncbi:hypothetical protein FHN55_17215 [Streptomyces sp. NP160]|nr:hypothetical protein FHN55_17215 [Streptomyces sp. NP160]
MAAVRVPSPRPERVSRPAAEPVVTAAVDVDLTGAALAPLDLSEPSARAAVRTWARERGLEVSPRGRLPRAVVEAFEAERAGLVSAR